MRAPPPSVIVDVMYALLLYMYYVYYNIFTPPYYILDRVAAEVSNHPVNITSKNGSMMPSAFIPYCSLGTNLDPLSEYITNMSFPVCQMFEPTVYKDQLHT